MADSALLLGVFRAVYPALKQSGYIQTISTQSHIQQIVASMVCSAFLLLSFAFLPVSKTHRHYLSICLTIAVVFMEVSTKALPRYYPNH
jgi:hypothetical protein